VKVQWTESAQASMRRFMADQEGMRAVNAAVAALTDDPEPPAAFVRGRYRRMRVGSYRVQYTVDGDIAAILRVDRVI
jgi:mRNA-degrading endonuclease RelE of RelBE toxin-antitoxin system